jgi:hypothetical protein
MGELVLLYTSIKELKTLNVINKILDCQTNWDQNSERKKEVRLVKDFISRGQTRKRNATKSMRRPIIHTKGGVRWPRA